MKLVYWFHYCITKVKKQRFPRKVTLAELEKVLSENEAEKMVDVISGATLADTKGYLAAIVEAAKTVK